MLKTWSTIFFIFSYFLLAEYWDRATFSIGPQNISQKLSTPTAKSKKLPQDLPGSSLSPWTRRGKKWSELSRLKFKLYFQAKLSRKFQVKNSVGTFRTTLPKSIKKTPPRTNVPQKNGKENKKAPLINHSNGDPKVLKYTLQPSDFAAISSS